MASEWKDVHLGELIEVKHGWPFKSELFSEQLSGRPIVINIGNFRYTGGFRFESTTVREYRGEYPKEYELSPGDMLLVMTCQTADGEILGIPARVPKDNRIYLHNQRLGRVVVRDPERVDSAFLYWLFLSPDFNSELYLSASGTKILHTAPSRIEAVKFRLPCLSEQRAIANVLGALDAKIDLNRQMNETLEKVARSLFKSWFIDFDPVRTKAAGRDPNLPNYLAHFFPDSFEDSELGEIPSGWNAVPLYEIATYINGAAYKAFEPNDERQGLPIIKIAELKSGVTPRTKFSDVRMPEKYLIKGGEILFSWSGNPDTSIDTFVWDGSDAWLNQHIFRVLPHQPHERTFVITLLKNLRPVFAEIARNKQTTGLGHVTAGDMKQLLVAMPDDRLMRAWNSVAQPLLDRAFLCERESKHLAALRDMLLPELISGTLRISDLEILGDASKCA